MLYYYHDRDGCYANYSGHCFSRNIDGHDYDYYYGADYSYDRFVNYDYYHGDDGVNYLHHCYYDDGGPGDGTK